MNIDVLIIGAGPGGLQLAHDLERRGRSYVVVERAETVGSFFRTFPRHRKLISVNKIHTGYDDERQMRFDWNSLLSHDDGCLFKSFSEEYFPPADAMVEYLQAFAARYVPSLVLGCEVRQVAKEEERFVVTTSTDRTFRARAVVVATGVPKLHRPKIQGLDLAQPYDTFDPSPARFENARVLILGKGNSAFETADAITHKAAVIHLVSPTPIRFAWNTHFPGHLRAVNNNFLDTYQLKIQNALLDATVRSLRRRDDGRIVATFEYTHAGGECEEIAYDHVISCAGFEMDTNIFAANTRPTTMIDDRFPALTSDFESANVPGLFFAGTLTQSLDFKKSNSAFVHGFRYNAQALGRILEARLYEKPLPYREGPVDVDWLCDTILFRINHSSAQWQQFSFVGDAVVFEPERVRYFEDLPVAHLQKSVVGQAKLSAVVTLEFGSKREDVFAVTRSPDVDSAADSFFLHPVVRVFSGGHLIETLHLLENLFGEWSSLSLHRQPLRAFLSAKLAAHHEDSAGSTHDSPPRPRRVLY